MRTKQKKEKKSIKDNSLNEMISRTLLCFTIICYLLSLLLSTNYFKTQNVKYPSKGEVPILDLTSDNKASSTFLSIVDDLSGIHIRFGTYQKQINNKMIEVTIKDTNDHVLRTIKTQSEKLQDNQYAVFDFEKIPNSKGNHYKVEVSCSKCEEKEVTIYGENRADSYQLSIAQYGKTYHFKYVIVLFTMATILLVIRTIIKKEQKNSSQDRIIEKLEKTHLLFPIEFILALIMGISLLKMLIDVKSSISFPLLSYLFFTISSMGVLQLIAIKIKEKQVSIQQFFLLLAIPISINYLILLPPTCAADEIVHYATAYKYASNKLFSTKNYIEVPSQIIDNAYPNMKGYQKLEDLLKTSPTTEMKISTIAEYTVINYAPASIGIGLGKIFHLPYFLGFYLARILTLITTLTLGYLAIKFLPIGKLLLCVYLLSPMAIHQSMAVSADAIINGLCILYIGYILYLNRKDTSLTRPEKIGLYILTLLIAFVKYVYIPLVFLLILFLLKEKLSKKEKRTILGIGLASIVLCILLFLYHMSLPKDIVSSWVTDNGISLTGQLVNLLKRPISVISVMINTLASRGTFYIETFLGVKLGWLHIEIERAVFYVYLVLLVISAFFTKEKENYNSKEKISFIAIFSIIFLLIIYGMYLTWTPIGASIAEGVQGRYFLPIAILPLLLLCDKERYVKVKNPLLISSTILLWIHFSVIMTIIGTFW